jgi:pyrophosphatase PpaX
MTTALLFDLDGTLIDSIELILNSARFAFEGFTGRPPSDDEWRAGIGRPLHAVFREYAPDETEAERLLGRYREYQLANHDRLVRAYEGIVPVIEALAKAGHPMALVTSKSSWMSQRALDHVGLTAAIPVIVGADSCDNHKPHPEPVERALAILGATPQNALFVGDSPFDVQAGRAAGVYTIGVTWGAFSREEMERCGADVVLDAVSELPRAIEEFEAGIG